MAQDDIPEELRRVSSPILLAAVLDELQYAVARFERVTWDGPADAIQEARAAVAAVLDLAVHTATYSHTVTPELADSIGTNPQPAPTEPHLA